MSEIENFPTQLQAIADTVEDMLIAARSEYQSAQGERIMRAGGKMDALFDVSYAIKEIRHG